MPFLEDNQQGAYGPVQQLPEQAPELESPGFGETLGAAFRVDNSVASFFASEGGPDVDPVEGYDPFGEDEFGLTPIGGYEDFADRFIESTSPAQTEVIKSNIDRELEDRKTLDAAGGWGMAASFAAGMADPLILVPVGGQLKLGAGAAKTGLRAAAGGAAGASVSEAALQATQETRTAGETAIAIGGATLLSGVAGSLVGAYKPGEFGRLSKAIDDEMIKPFEEAPQAAENMAGASVGARATRDTTLEQESLAPAFGADTKLKQLNPLLRLADSPSIESRHALQDIAEVPLEFRKNREGIPSPISAENEVRSWDAPLGRFVSELDQLYVQYRTGEWGGRAKRLKIQAKDLARGRGSQTLSYSKFKEAVGQAARRNDEHPIPQVARAARQFRQRLADPLKNEAIGAKLLPEDVEVTTADSYFPRLYDVPRINAERPQFREIIVRSLVNERDQARKRLDQKEADIGIAMRQAEREGNARGVELNSRKLDALGDERIHADLDDLDLIDIAEQIINHITGTPAGRIPHEASTLNRGPLKGRVFYIDDYDIEEYLIDDVAAVAAAHVRTIAPDVALAKRFGPEVDEPFQKVIDEYDDLIRKAETDRERAKLAKQKAADLRDLGALRDRLRGVYKMPDDPDHWALKASRLVRTWNYVRMLGGVTISSLTDIARPVMVEGLYRTLGTGVVPMVRGMKALKMSKREAQLAGTAWDMALDTRAINLAELGNDYSMYSKVDKASQTMSSVFSVASLISPWTEFTKSFSSMVIGTRILESTAKWTDTGKLSKKNISKLAQSGIDHETAALIASEFKQYGFKHKGVWVANTDKWQNGYAAEAFRAALARDIDRTIITPGIADRPLWMSSEVGKLVGQFRTFAFAATNRMMLAGFQQRDLAVLNGAILTVAMGSGVYGLKSMVAGIELSDDPKVWLAEGIDRSGLLGILMDANNVAEKATGGKIGVSAFTGTEGMSRYALRNDIGALLGPTMGTVKDTLTVARMLADDEIKESDIGAARRLIPFQNLFYLRGLITHMQQETAEQLEAK